MPDRCILTFEYLLNWAKDNFSISTDKSRLDIDFIHGFLRTTYWAASRTREEVATSIENSICFGLFYEERQIGFARLVTDEAVFSWLGDVFIVPEFQKRGLGTWLIECVVSHPVAKRTKCLLGTRDAHGLYEKFGWYRREAMFRPENGEEDSN